MTSDLAGLYSMRIVAGPPTEKIVKGDDTDKTLAKIAEAAKLDDWQIIARYNWGTARKDEVNRALFEYIGWNDKNKDPEKTVLVPHPDALRKIKIPKVWDGGSRAVDKMHVVTLRPEPKPPVAIRIDNLDKWFIPRKEKCRLKYSLQGLKSCAGKLALEVYGSNYCDLSAYNANTDVPTFAARAAATPLYKPDVKTDFAERSSENWPEWRGEVNVGAGVLKKRNDKAPDRYINVAFSPYTVLLRLYNTDGDKDAKLLLKNFWPQFRPDGKLDGTRDESKIRWNLSTTRFEANGAGTLEIWDRHDHVVFRKPLSANELKKGDITVEWKDGGKYSPGKTNSAGGDTAIADDMPYRAQVQIHTGPNEDNGLALAAMHTEVRLYVHPDTRPLDTDPYVAKDDRNSALLVCADSLLAMKKYERGDGLPWVKLMLAKAGFHPGPVDSSNANADYRIALKEFERSVPKKRAKDKGPYERFPAIAPATDFSGEARAVKAIKDTLADLPESDWKREWFGKADDRADLPTDRDDFREAVTDPTADLVAWVDNRHAYTRSDLQGAALNEYQASLASMADYAGAFNQGDASVDTLAGAIPRPCLPFAARFPLMSRRHSLFKIIETLPEEHVVPEAVGPLRVDWTFDEIDAKPASQDSVDPAMYGPDANFPAVSRTKEQLQRLVGRYQADYTRRDRIHAVYTNCPVAYGGIRPEAAPDVAAADRQNRRNTALAAYYKAAFATAEADRLRPYPVIDDAGNERIATVAHDDLGQPEANVSADHMGCAGVYFRPSRIAGDGYKLRAQLRFETVGGYDFPNLATLRTRYPRLPQAWSAKIRLWRKASIRGYVGWAENQHWNANRAAVFKHYEPGCVHFVYERGETDVNVKPSEIFPTAREFRDLIRKGLDRLGADKVRWNIISLDYKRLWPWFSNNHYGYPEHSAAADIGQARAALFKFDDIADKFTNLLAWRCAERIEKTKGKLRGHVLCQFDLDVPWWVRHYVCSRNGSHHYFFVERTATACSESNTRCRAPGCTGRLQPVRFMFGAECSAGHRAWYPRSSATAPDPGKCTQCHRVPHALLNNVEEYACSRCNWKGKFWENAAGGGRSEGQDCTQPGCGGKLYSTSAWKQDYKCSKCHQVVQNLPERGNAGGAHTDEVHCGWLSLTGQGKLRPEGAVKQPPAHLVVPNGQVILPDSGVRQGSTTLAISSIGQQLGVALVANNRADTWAHEICHHRFMEHAATAGGAKPAQHDSVANNGIVWTALPKPETLANNKRWDRACLMSYVRNQASYDEHRDKRYMCAKCALKQRGWKVEALAALEVVAVAPPRGKTGIAYAGLPLAASGGTPAYTWTCAPADVAAGTVGLPHNGLNLDAPNEEISGTPAAVEKFKVKIVVTDSLGDTAEQIVEIETLDPLVITAVAPARLRATRGTAYSLTLAATGGKAAYTWSCAEADGGAGTVKLPHNGLSLAGDTVSGTPAGAAKTKFKIVVTDSVGDKAEQVLEIEALDPLAIAAAAPARGKAGNPYAGLALTATGGKPAYNWSCAPADAGAGTVLLPHNGLALAGSAVSGTPAAAGSVKFKAVVTDSLGNKAEQVITIVVDP